jgi:acetate kinase
MRVLVVNSGSSSLKLRLVDGDDVIGSEDLDAVDVTPPDAILGAVRRLAPFDAVGHRVVHGGERFRTPVLISGRVRDELTALTPLAPLHQPAALHAIDIVSVAAGDAPAVACFDTAFHATLPAAATTYAIPVRWRKELGVRKFGFHGLAHASVARRAGALLDNPEGLRLVTCHLGAGASLAAVVGGKCVDTTMGFTPLDGLVMATRSGSLDPGAVLWLQEHAGVSAAEISDALEHRSGLQGLSGATDMRDVLRRAAAGDVDARLAIAVYGHRLRAGIAAMAAAANGLDAVVFSGGVGENAPVIRAEAIGGLAFLGLTMDPTHNQIAEPDCEISGPGRVRTFVIAAREELEIARSVRELLGERS